MRNKKDRVTLSQLARTQSGEIIRVDGDSTRSQRLMALGFLPGCRVRVVEVAPFGDPIAVELDGWRVSLRRSEASLIAIKEDDNS